MRPGLANAFLLGFIESLADFGNPLVLGGNFDVLSTEIFFAMVGAQHDQGRAAVLAVILLAFTLVAFWAQQRWLGRKSYTTVTGKGDAGVPLRLPQAVGVLCYATALPWAALTASSTSRSSFGGLVESWGRDHTPTLRHYVHAFGVTTGDHGLVWSARPGTASGPRLQISLVAAVPTAAHRPADRLAAGAPGFRLQARFEFGTMLSFAIPGTVIGIAYVLAFNVPPIELTGTGIILVIAFIFRNMPVGVRAGIATMSQLDRSLDEASLTLRAGNLTTVRRVVLPLLRPAILAALVYSFVRAMTAISAVVFLVSANYEMATTYILGRVENGDYGLAIAYSSVLILVMLAVIGLFQLAVGERRLGRRAAPALVGAGSRHERARRSVRFERVSKAYGSVVAVREVSFEIEAGHLVTLLGPSGCGKTTTLRMIAGLELATSGRILIGDAGRDRPAGDRARRRHGVPVLRAVPAHDGDRERRLRAQRVGRAQGRGARAGRAGAGAGRAGRLRRAAAERAVRRPAAARRGGPCAWCCEPQVLLFDEPLSNLDAKLRRHVREEIRELQQKLGITAVYVTHDQAEALAISDRVIVMSNAAIAQEGTPRELYEEPADRFVADFIGDANIVEGQIVALDGDYAEVRLGTATLRLPHRGLGPGQRLDRDQAGVDPAVGQPGRRAPGAGAKTSYLGSHIEYELGTPVGELFAIDADATRLLAPDTESASASPTGESR